jgi:hypothetical protein
MTPDERERMYYLCKCLAGEKDPGTFARLLDELNILLEVKQERLDPEDKTKPN